MMHDSLSSPVGMTPHLPSLVPPVTPQPSVARRLEVYVKQALKTREQRNRVHANADESKN